MTATPTALTERAFTDQVLGLAAAFGYTRAHFRPAMTKYGWRTPVSGDGKGFPDLVLLRGPRLVVAELKAGKNTLTIEQRAWLAAWRAVGAEVFVWEPSQLEEIARVLR